VLWFNQENGLRFGARITLLMLNTQSLSMVNCSAQDSNSRRKNILIVDDEENITRVWAQIVRRASNNTISVQTTNSALDALEIFKQNKIDLVISDQRMPGMCGLDLIERIKTQSPETLTILITGYGSAEVEERANRLQVFHYMTKPVPAGDLIRVIKDALELGHGESGTPQPSTPENEPAPLKIALGGDGCVGKTTLIRRLCTGAFDPTRKMTIGVDFHLYDLPASRSSTRLIVWDLSGQERFAFTRRAFYRGSRAVGLVYAIDDRASFDRLVTWRNEVREILPKVPLVLVGNKVDSERQVTREEGLALAQLWNIPFFETSCATGESVLDFFGALSEMAQQSVSVSIGQRIREESNQR
jgi:small GTP-binding protein